MQKKHTNWNISLVVDICSIYLKKHYKQISIYSVYTFISACVPFLWVCFSISQKTNPATPTMVAPTWRSQLLRPPRYLETNGWKKSPGPKTDIAPSENISSWWFFTHQPIWIKYMQPSKWESDLPQGFLGGENSKKKWVAKTPVAKALASEKDRFQHVLSVLVFKHGNLFNKEHHNFPTKSPPYLGAGVPSLHWNNHVFFSNKNNWGNQVIFLCENMLDLCYITAFRSQKSPEIHGGKMCGNHTSWIHLPLHSLCHWGEDMCALWGLLYWIFLRLRTSHDPRSYWIIYTSYHQFCIFPYDSYDMTLTP